MYGNIVKLFEIYLLKSTSVLNINVVHARNAEKLSDNFFVTRRGSNFPDG